MATDHKFMGLLMAQEDIDFAEVFKSFPEEEQNSFVDFTIAVLSNVMSSLKELPQEMKAEVLYQVLSLMPLETRVTFGELIGIVEVTD